LEVSHDLSPLFLYLSLQQRRIRLVLPEMLPP
jgi:hypothetical protein